MSPAKFEPTVPASDRPQNPLLQNVNVMLLGTEYLTFLKYLCKCRSPKVQGTLYRINSLEQRFAKRVPRIPRDPRPRPMGSVDTFM